jgi:hypothetical protein
VRNRAWLGWEANGGHEWIGGNRAEGLLHGAASAEQRPADAGILPWSEVYQDSDFAGEGKNPCCPSRCGHRQSALKGCLAIGVGVECSRSEDSGGPTSAPPSPLSGLERARAILGRCRDGPPSWLMETLRIRPRRGAAGRLQQEVRRSLAAGVSVGDILSQPSNLTAAVAARRHSGS